MVRAYYKLIKPGIVYENLFTVLAGYLFATHFHISWSVLIGALLGMGCVIAGSCVLNNILDRGIDSKMARTKERGTVTGAISLPSALVFASVLLLCGIGLLYSFTNLLTLCVALIGAFFYVVVYGAAKRWNRTHTLVGSIAGAVPIVSGYTAATGVIGVPGFILFVILVLWQMPHFYAIALYRADEYRAAGIPLLPDVAGPYLTKMVMVTYIVGFVIAEVSLTVLGYTGYTYLAVVLGFGIAWFFRAVQGFKAADDVEWAKQQFYFSIKVLTWFCIALAVGSVLG